MKKFSCLAAMVVVALFSSVGKADEAYVLSLIAEARGYLATATDNLNQAASTNDEADTDVYQTMDQLYLLYEAGCEEYMETYGIDCNVLEYDISVTEGEINDCQYAIDLVYDNLNVIEAAVEDLPPNTDPNYWDLLDHCTQEALHQRSEANDLKNESVTLDAEAIVHAIDAGLLYITVFLLECEGVGC